VCDDAFMHAWVVFLIQGEPGIIPRLCHSLWDKLKVEQEGIRMEVSFMEIYREKVRDLLKSPSSPLKLREHPQYGPHVQGSDADDDFDYIH